ncbi:MAG: cupin domain-containing protein [Sandaracinus sp.]|nr:cupin domain-containing protein [Sandaracinus sp.]
MREGEVVHPSPGETVRCLRSGSAGGPFVFEVELAPGAKGPPTHTHDEGDEVVEMLAGEVVFRIHGREQRLKAGDRLTLTPADPHTFWNPSKTTPARARVTHGARFERLIAQPSLLAIARYLTEVDPGASRTHHPLMRVGLHVIAFVARLRGVRPNRA